MHYDCLDDNVSLPENSLFYYESMNGLVSRAARGMSGVARTVFTHLLQSQVPRRKMDKATELSQMAFI